MNKEQKESLIIDDVHVFSREEMEMILKSKVIEVLEEIKSEGYNMINKCMANFRATDKGDLPNQDRDRMNKNLVDGFVDDIKKELLEDNK